jgi:hypothetical protein
MLRLLPALGLLALALAGPAAASPAGQGAADVEAGSQQLRMLRIRATAEELRRLRAMPVDIVRVRSPANDAADGSRTEMLERRFVVDAVVPSGLIGKLSAMGFEFTAVE